MAKYGQLYRGPVKKNRYFSRTMPSLVDDASKCTTATSGDNSSAFQRIIDMVHADGGGDIYGPPGQWPIYDGIDTKSCRLVLDEHCSLQHTNFATDSPCVTVSKWGGFEGGRIWKNGTGYNGIMLRTNPESYFGRAVNLRIKTRLEGNNVPGGKAFSVYLDGDQAASSGLSTVEWSQIDLNIFNMGYGIHIDHNEAAATGNATYFNGNRVQARFSNCNVPYYSRMNTLYADCGSNTYDFVMQLSSNTTHIMQINGHTDNHFHIDLFDWDGETYIEDQNLSYSNDGNFGNTFMGSLQFGMFYNRTSGFKGDMRLGGIDNQIVKANTRGMPVLRLDSSAATSTDNGWFLQSAAAMRGHIWWDEADDTLNWSDGTNVMQLTGATA